MIKFLITQFSPVSGHLFRLRPKCLPQHSVPKHSLLDMTDQASHSYKTKRKYAFQPYYMHYIRIAVTAHITLCISFVYCTANIFFVYLKHFCISCLFTVSSKVYCSSDMSAVFPSCLLCLRNVFGRDRKYSGFIPQILLYKFNRLLILKLLCVREDTTAVFMLRTEGNNTTKTKTKNLLLNS